MKIYTPTGKVYAIDAQGNINGSTDWKLLGIEHVKRNEFIPFNKIAETLPTLELKFKNGKPQYTGRDSDHGTTRTWGNTQYHGISGIAID